MPACGKEGPFLPEKEGNLWHFCSFPLSHFLHPILPIDGGCPMTNVEFHLQLNHNETWSMSRLHFHDHFELLLPLTSPGNISKWS